MPVNCHPSLTLRLRLNSFKYIVEYCADELSLHTTHIKMEVNVTSIQGKEGRQENKRQRPGSSDEDCSTFLCQKCDQNIHDKVTCSCCKLHYCLQCAKISAILYQCFRNNELQNFHWTCSACTSMFPSLENISGTLNDIKVKHEHRMNIIENRMDNLEISTKQEIKTSVSAMKKDIVDDIKQEVKQDLNKMVDDRNKEFDDRRRREMNIVIFNLKEHHNDSGQINKLKDEKDIKTLAIALGLEELKIVTSYRLGKPRSTTRPLKVILEDRTQRKFLIDNAKFIPKKAPHPLRDVIIIKDLTPLQQAEKRQFVKERKNKKKKPEQTADSEGAEAPSMAVDRQEPEISPILNREQLSQMNVFDDSRPLESTRLMASHFFERSTITEDKTIIGGLSQDTTLQSSPSLLRR